MANDTVMTTEQLCGWLGLSRQSLAELVRRGIVPKLGRGRFNAGEATRAYVDHLRGIAAGRRGDGDIDLVQERALLARAQRERLEREAAVAARELLPAADVRDAWVKHITAAKTRILGIPAACKSRNSDLPLPVVANIERACRDALEDLAGGPEHG